MIRILLVFFLTLSIFAEEKKTDTKDVDDKKPKFLTHEESQRLEKEGELKRKEYKYIADFLKKEYVLKAEKESESLEKSLIQKNRQLQVTSSQKAKERINEEIIALKAKIESLKIWPLYHKAYIIKEGSYDNGDMEKYRKAKGYLKLLEAKYKQLTATNFPNYQGIFYARYGTKLKERRDRELKN